MAKDVLNEENRKYLENVFESLDPIRLLQQIKNIQDSLWKHVVPAFSDSNDIEDPLKFDSDKCSSSKNTSMDNMAVDFMNKSMENEKRKYRRSRKSRVSHTWKTRKNPFDKVWEEVCMILEEKPEKTAKSIFIGLQQKYPGRFKDGQLRTMQRHVKVWRSKAILTFDYEWLKDEILVVDKFTPKFHGKIIREASL